MILNDRPNMPAAIIASFIAGLFAVDAFGFGYPAWVYLVVGIFAWVALFLWLNWISFHVETHRVWRNTAENGRGWVELETAKAILKMSPEQLEIWLHKTEADAYIRAFQAAAGDTALAEQVLSRLSDNLDRAQELSERMRRSAAVIADEESTDKRWYALDAITYARAHGGKLPVIRDVKSGQGSIERTAYEMLRKELIRLGIARGTPGHQAYILDGKIDEAEQVAREIGV